MTTEESQAVVRTDQPEIPRLSLELVKETKRQIELLKTMVKETLIRGIDFGRVPGAPSEGLWDPGAQTIMAGFNVYAGHRRILSLIDDDERISVIIETPGIDRKTGKESATGIGSASTLETKFKYRWVPKHEALESFDEEDLATLRTRTRDNEVLYRIPNPEYSELLHNIIKMAAKRSEVDLAESLPGVSPALREIFDPRAPKTSKGGESGQPQNDWTRFWGDVTRLGLGKAEAEEILGVQSVKDWLTAGKTLDQALTTLQDEIKGRAVAARSAQAPASAAPPQPPPAGSAPPTVGDQPHRGPGRPRREPGPTKEWEEFRQKAKELGFTVFGLMDPEELTKVLPNWKQLSHATDPALFAAALKTLEAKRPPAPSSPPAPTPPTGTTAAPPSGAATTAVATSDKGGLTLEEFKAQVKEIGLDTKEKILALLPGLTRLDQIPTKYGSWGAAYMELVRLASQTANPDIDL